MSNPETQLRKERLLAGKSVFGNNYISKVQRGGAGLSSRNLNSQNFPAKDKPASASKVCSQVQKENIDKDVQKLVDIFPHMNLDDLNQVWQDCHGDLDVGVGMILSMENTVPYESGVDSAEVHEPELEPLKVNKESQDLSTLASMFPDRSMDQLRAVLATSGTIETAIETLFKPTTGTSKGNWTERQKVVDEVGHFLPIPEKDIISLLHSNGFDAAKAVADFLVNYDKDLENMKTAAKPYVYHELSKESLELEDLIQGNPPFKTLGKQFWIRCMEFYQGDVDKCIHVAQFLLLHNAAKHTSAKKKLSLPTVSIKMAKPAVTSTHIQPVSSYPVAFNQVSQAESLRAAKNMYDNIFTESKADLHGFLNADVKAILPALLAKWWREELSQREQNARSGGGSARFVKPYLIVTGKGIHSVGGRSKNRIWVKEYLQQHNWVFDEGSSFFEVTGKKRG